MGAAEFPGWDVKKRLTAPRFLATPESALCWEEVPTPY